MKTTVREFAEKFRSLAGDETQSIPDDFIVNSINWAFNSLPSVPKLDKAFAKHYTSRLNANNHWRFKLNKDFRFISNTPMINFFTSTGGDPCPLDLCYRDNVEFFQKNGMVNLKMSGTPCEYTLERDGDDLYLIFDRPLNIPVIIDYVVWGYPKPVPGIYTERLVYDKELEEKVLVQSDVELDISAPVENLILHTMRKVFYEEASDFAFAGAIGDYLDNKMLPEIIQMLNKRFNIGQPVIVGEP